MPDVIVTEEEQKALRSLLRLAKKWPQSLSLFSWSGTLVAMKDGPDGRGCTIITIPGIPNDGGDPSSDEVNQFPDVEFE